MYGAPQLKWSSLRSEPKLIKNYDIYACLITMSWLSRSSPAAACRLHVKGGQLTCSLTCSLLKNMSYFYNIGLSSIFRLSDVFLRIVNETITSKSALSRTSFSSVNAPKASQDQQKKKQAKIVLTVKIVFREYFTNLVKLLVHSMIKMKLSPMRFCLFAFFCLNLGPFGPFGPFQDREG